MKARLFAALALVTANPASAVSPLSLGRFGSWEVISAQAMPVPRGQLRKPTHLYAVARSDDNQLRWMVETYGDRYFVETVAIPKTHCRTVRRTDQHATTLLSSEAVLDEFIRQTRWVRGCVHSPVSTPSADPGLLKAAKDDLHKALVALNAAARRIYG